MQIHEIHPTYKLKKRKRVGRGGKRGTYSGRGIKGQRSRAGRRFQPIIRQTIKRYPKLRGYRFKKIKLKPALVNIDILEGKFKNSDLVSPKVLLQRHIIRRIKGRVPEVKILGKGKITKKITIENCQISKGAKEKIEKAGGIIRFN